MSDEIKTIMKELDDKEKHPFHRNKYSAYVYLLIIFSFYGLILYDSMTGNISKISLDNYLSGEVIKYIEIGVAVIAFILVVVWFVFAYKDRTKRGFWEDGYPFE